MIFNDLLMVLNAFWRCLVAHLFEKGTKTLKDSYQRKFRRETSELRKVAKRVRAGA